MFSLWQYYSETLPILPWGAAVLTSVLILMLVRPFVLFYFKIGALSKLLQEQVRLQKKILEEMQFLRLSSRQNHNLPSKKVEFREAIEETKQPSLRPSEAYEEQPIKIELKKDTH